MASVLLRSLLLVCYLAVGHGLSYEAGKTYSYSYVAEVEFSDPNVGSEWSSDGSTVGFKLSSLVDLSVVWQNPQDANEKVWKLTFADTRLLNSSERAEEHNTYSTPPTSLQVVTSQPLYVVTKSGRVDTVYGSTSETPSSLNIKKGVASLLQVQTVEGTAQEVDTSGDCQVTYVTANDKITKVKNLASCKNPVSVNDFRHPRRILGVGVQSECSTVCTLSDDKATVQSAVTTESYTFAVSLRESVASTVQASQSITLRNSVDGATLLQGSSAEGAVQSTGSFLAQTLSAELVDQQCTEACQSAADVVEKHRDNIKSEFLSKTESSSAFIEILQAFRSSGKDTLVDILMSDANEEIRPQLLDIIAATQTTASWEAALELLDFGNDELADIIEKFLVNTAFNNHPSEAQLQKLLDLLQNNEVPNENIQKTMALSLGAIVKVYCAVSEEQCDSQVIKNILDFFLEGLKSEDREIRLVSLYALKNAAQPSTLLDILNIAKDDSDMDLIEVAVDAMSQFDEKLFTKEVNRGLNSLYHQNKRRYSNVVRVAAASLVLGKNPTIQDVVNIALSIGCQDSDEFAKFIYSKMITLSEEDTPAAAVIRQALSEDLVHNYASVRSGGFSNAYRSFLAEMEAANAPFELDLQMTGAGLLRKSTFEVRINAANDSLIILQVLLFSRGLESFFGEDTGDEGESTAGLAVQLLGIALRPIVFFSGSGDLMSMAWSLGSASDSSYSAVQGLILLQDHAQRLTLQSGFDIEANIQGGLSVDLGGSLDFSLWQRSSTTLVYNSGAMSLRGSTRVISPLLDAGIKYGADAQGHIDFVTTVQFSSLPPSFCLQMMQEPLFYRQFVKKYEQLEESPRKFKVAYSRKVDILDTSFKLFNENSPMCHEMFGKEEEDSGGWW